MAHKLNADDFKDFDYINDLASYAGKNFTNKRLCIHIKMDGYTYFTKDDINGVIYHPSLKDAVDYYNGIV